MMWFNNEVSQCMFMEKVRNQSLELETVRKRHETLTTHYKRLEKERNNLNDLVQLNQINIVTGKNHLNELLTELKAQKQQNMVLSQRLELYNEQIDATQANLDESYNSMSSSITELKPIREKLSFKWDVVECLQTKLIETRLQVAEKGAILAELQRRKNELENDVMVLKEDNMGSVSQLQEEFLAAKIREADVILEFDKLKRSIAIVKQELKEQKLEMEKENDCEDGDYFRINFNIRDKFNDKLRLDENASIVKTIELQNEIDYLKMQAKKLEDIKEDINKRINFNEETKVQLYEVRTSIFHRQQKAAAELEKLIQRREKLEEKLNYELSEIRKRIEAKDSAILDLVQKTKTLQLENEISEENNDESLDSLKKNTINMLEEEAHSLEDQIMTLSNND